MKHAWLWYSVIRISLFGALTAVLWWLGIHPVLAAVIAAVLAFGISYFALAPLRREFSAELSRSRQTREPSDEEVEDATGIDDAGRIADETRSDSGRAEHPEPEE